MNISREEAIAELRRRGKPIPGEDMTFEKPVITKEQAIEELKRRGLPLQKEGLHPLHSLGIGIETAGGNLTHGILQPLLESGYLGEKIKQASKNVAAKRRAQYEESERQNPLSTMSGKVGFDIYSALPAATLSGGTSFLSKTPGFMKYLSSVLGGAAGGGLSGAAQYVNPEESRLENALLGSVGGGIAGSLGPAVTGAFRTGKSITKAYPAKKIAEKIMEDKNVVRNTYKNAYENLFKEAEKEGIHRLHVPKINIKSIKKNTTTKEFEALESFLHEPTLRNAHRAQSDLGKTIRRLEKIHEGVGLNTSQQRALESALKAQKKIRGSMFEEFTKKGDKALADEYSKLTKGYASEVLPYIKSKPINQYRKGELTEKDFISSLNRNKKFQAQLGEKYPELETRKTMEGLKKGIVGSGKTAGVIELMHLFGMI